MQKKTAAAAIALIFLLPLFIMAQDGTVKTATQNKVTVTVKKITDEIKGFKTFEVTAENMNTTKKTLEGRICLENDTVKQGPCGSGECTIYMELGPGEKKTIKKDCKEISGSNIWNVKIVKVYNF